jgi:hypothetical protein
MKLYLQGDLCNEHVADVTLHGAPAIPLARDSAVVLNQGEASSHRPAFNADGIRIRQMILHHWREAALLVVPIVKARPSKVVEANAVQPRGPLSVYAVLLSSVGRQRLCTPLRSLLARGDHQ